MSFYIGNDLLLISQSIEGSFSIFNYTTSDTIDEVIAANYFADGGERGMRVGDWIFCISAGLPFLLYVSASNGLSCTAESAVLALSGGSFPTTAPPAGSGVIWNNGNFLCVA